MIRCIVMRLWAGLRPAAARPLDANDAGGGKMGRGSCGHQVTVNRFTVNGGLKVGKYCSFCRGAEFLLGGNHQHDWVTTFPLSPRFRRFRHLPPSAAIKGDIVVGYCFWIGQTMIPSGVTISNGSVIGARWWGAMWRLKR